MKILTQSEFITRTYDNESKFTADANMYISHNYPMLRGLYYHIPNESSTSDLMRMKLHAMGVLPGVPDFRFEPITIKSPNPTREPATIINGWYLELKLPKKRLSPSQLSLHDHWKNNGITVEIAYTPNDVSEHLIKRYGEP